jgi:hypothetical protein
MNVKVTIELSALPQEEDFDCLRRAAADLTDNPNSIVVQM